MGSVIITGANGCIAIKTVEYILKHHPSITLILTVRNNTPADVNTQALHTLLSQYPQTEEKSSVHGLDLTKLSNVRSFADGVINGIAAGAYPPLKSIICSASQQALMDHVKLSEEDGYETTFKVNHIAQAALVMRLLGHFGPDGGRVLLFSCDAHLSTQNKPEKISIGLPADLDTLVKPDRLGETDAALGFQRYANSKLAVTSWSNGLNRRLQADSKISKITAVVMNPGNISDSRAFQTNPPQSLIPVQTLIIKPVMSALRYLSDPSMRTSSAAGVDVAQMALGVAHPSERGHFTLPEKDHSSMESLEEQKQERLWNKTLEWAKISMGDTALAV